MYCKSRGQTRRLPEVAAWALIAAAAAFAQGQTQRSASADRAKSRASATAGKSRVATGKFSRRVNAALLEAHAEKAFWGILVAEAGTGKLVYELNPDHFFTPASNAKLFTTALAMATLGPDYRFRTTIESRGTLSADGRLQGDLIFVGRGDPNLSNRKFPLGAKVEHEGPAEKILAEMADAVVARGVKAIDGDVIGDDSYFPYDPYPAGWSAGDLYFSFGAPISAIAVNDNTISIEVTPGARLGDPASLTIAPWPGYETFGHEITTSASDSKPKFAVVREPGTKPILFRGSIPLGAPPIRLDLAMDDPAEYSAHALKLLLEARGVQIAGQARAQHGLSPDRGEVLASVAAPTPAPVATGEAPVDSGATPLVLAEHFSPPLVDMIRVVNKVSQNLHAELLLRAVAKEKAGTGTTDAGIQVEQDFLKSVGIADGDAVLVDGSGLSRENLVTPRAVLTLLQYVARQPWGEQFASTLPVAGEDGTLENRLRNTSAAGRIYAKTGSLEHVRAMSGYASTRRGAHLVFTLFGNNDPEKAADATAVLDATCEAMVEEIGPLRKK
jgi:D-alanyl-D-alanine carboxypeptidase/D-alanyl-D-alanine-endopeptidase (penicillin-binding protein 4)